MTTGRAMPTNKAVGTDAFLAEFAKKMIRKTVLRLGLAIALVVPAGAQTVESSPGSDFEELPDLQASEILKDEFLRGPHYSVRESVPTSSGLNEFWIDSDFGVFEADGNEMLVRRVKEIYAIAQLREISRTDEFKKSLAAAAKSKLAAAKNIVEDPGQAISNVPKGVMKFMGRAGESIKNVGKKKDNGYDDGGNTLEKTIGYSQAKRSIAVSMGIDPYSKNEVLQKELNEVARASWAGGFAFSAGTFPIGGAAGIALTATGVSSSLDKIVQEKPPADLKNINRTELRNMGASEKETERFLNNIAFSPTEQTAFVLNLKSLDHVANRAAFVRAAAENSSNESDALFCVQTSALMSDLHAGEHPLARIAMIRNLPVCIAKDGAVIVALQWDYAAWTAGAAGMTEEVLSLAQKSGNKGVYVSLSGQASPHLKQELQSRGITIVERVSPGPLK